VLEYFLLSALNILLLNFVRYSIVLVILKYITTNNQIDFCVGFIILFVRC